MMDVSTVVMSIANGATVVHIRGYYHGYDHDDIEHDPCYYDGKDGDWKVSKLILIIATR